MTNEEAVGNLTHAIRWNDMPKKEALDMAIKALEQQPCEDAISRQAVLDCLTATKLKKFDFILHIREEIKKLPPATPQPKTGRWIKSRDSYGNNHFTCPFCEHDIATKYAGTWEDNYCSNCGARLESEDKFQNI